jgi:hypothetical protein
LHEDASTEIEGVMSKNIDQAIYQTFFEVEMKTSKDKRLALQAAGQEIHNTRSLLKLKALIDVADIKALNQLIDKEFKAKAKLWHYLADGQFQCKQPFNLRKVEIPTQIEFMVAEKLFSISNKGFADEDVARKSPLDYLIQQLSMRKPRLHNVKARLLSELFFQQGAMLSDASLTKLKHKPKLQWLIETEILENFILNKGKLTKRAKSLLDKIDKNLDMLLHEHPDYVLHIEQAACEQFLKTGPKHTKLLCKKTRCGIAHALAKSLDANCLDGLVEHLRDNLPDAFKVDCHGNTPLDYLRKNRGYKVVAITLQKIIFLLRQNTLPENSIERFWVRSESASLGFVLGGAFSFWQLPSEYIKSERHGLEKFIIAAGLLFGTFLYHSYFIGGLLLACFSLGALRGFYRGLKHDPTIEIETYKLLGSLNDRYDECELQALLLSAKQKMIADARAKGLSTDDLKAEAFEVDGLDQAIQPFPPASIYTPTYPSFSLHEGYLKMKEQALRKKRGKAATESMDLIEEVGKRPKRKSTKVQSRKKKTATAAKRRTAKKRPKSESHE